jgi:threonine dehydratase
LIPLVSLDDIKLAQRRINGVAVRTPLIPYSQAGDDRQLYFKPENFQPIGAFKIRGAYNKIASLTTEEKQRGVISYSSGNHAQGVAYAARELGVRATIVMPGNAPKIKLDNTRALGASIVQVGNGGEERRIKAEELAAEHGYMMVPPYNDETLIAGQGTVGLEILEDLPQVNTILVPIGGGGLISGVAVAIKLSNPRIRVIGVEPALAGDAHASLRAGTLVEFPPEQTGQTIADGLRAQHLGDITFAHIQNYVDDIVTVSEDEIKEAVRQMVFGAHLVAEPSGAVTFAAYLFHRDELPEARFTVAIISGGNVEPEVLIRILAEPSTAPV